MGTEEIKGKVLVMDDEDMVGEIASQILIYLGYDALHVKDGKDAVDEYARSFEAGEPFDLVIMDLTIPGGMGGKDAVTAVLAIDPEAKVLVSSGYSTDPIVTNYSDYGFKGVLNKPFDLVAMKEIIEALI